MIAKWYKAISPLLTAAIHGAFVKNNFLANLFSVSGGKPIRLVRRRGHRDLVLRLSSSVLW